MYEAEPTSFQGANRTTTSKAAGRQNAQNHPISSEEHQRQAFAPRKIMVVSKMREEQKAHEENKCCRNFGCEGSTYVLEANGLSENQ